MRKARSSTKARARQNWGGVASETGKEGTPKPEGTTPETPDKVTPPKPTVKKLLPATCDGKPWSSKQWCISTLASKDFDTDTPHEIAVTKDGTAYVATYDNYIKKIVVDKDGKATVSIIAGDGTADWEGTGDFKDATIGTEAQFNNPAGITIDTTGNVLYVADAGNHRIRRISLTHPYPVITIAGSTLGYADNPTGTSAQFNSTKGIAVDTTGNVLYVADAGNHRIRRISLTHPYPVITIAGTGKTDYADGDGSTAQFYYPAGITIAKDGNTLYVADAGNHRIRRISLTHPYEVSTISTDVKNPQWIAVDTTGNVLYVTDRNNDRIRRISLISPYPVITIAGSGKAGKGKADGIGTTAQFNLPTGIAVVSDTLLYVVDAGNRSIRKLEYKEAE